MALDAATAQELINKLQADRDVYLASVTRTHELLTQAIAASSNGFSASPQRVTPEALRRATTTTMEVESVNDSGTSGKKTQGSGSYMDESDSDDNESLFVSQPLDKETYDLEGFRHHLKTYPWRDSSRSILQDLLGNDKVLNDKDIFPTHPGPVDDRSHHSHYSIFDVGPDGAPLAIKTASDASLDSSRSLSIWNRIKSTNADPRRERQACGRITIVREPSPLLYAALHYTHEKHFDVEEMFHFMWDAAPELAHPHRAFDDDHRRQRCFVYTMEYFTIIGEGCKPARWQLSDKDTESNAAHIPISRCSSSFALSLSGEPLGKVRNRDRRVNRKLGNVYDPFAPWRVLSIQAYPDWRSSVDSHDATKHYVNGPEAFLVTLRAEFRDARKRLHEVNKRISEMVEPPVDFMFNEGVRDKLLFEDKHFTYSRRYFWAYQSLGIMNQDIHQMVTSFRETFKEHVWNGSNKIIWPGEETVSSRHAQWRRRMANIRKDLDGEMERLLDIQRMNEDKIKEIKGLRDNLFSGTSVLESRRSVEQSQITVKQGRNIKLLTLVTIFFLPLTFVTSVFGMTGIPTGDKFSHFAYSTIAICVPTYLLIGTLNTEAGLAWWQGHLRIIWGAILAALICVLTSLHINPAWAKPKDTKQEMDDNQKLAMRPRKRRSTSAEGNMLTRRTTNAGMPVLSPRETMDQKDYRSIIDAVNGKPHREYRERSPPAIRFSGRTRTDSMRRDMAAATAAATSSGSQEQSIGPLSQSPTAMSMRSREPTFDKLEEISEETGDEKSSHRGSQSGSLFSRLLKRRGSKQAELDEKDVC
ncbi:MAG: hypothetical protein M1828_003470 [Chrysothrix sp. TS-e1954]|nr:MAG: hypothetical protein M1828_003470 [Chrysothrix sp. TS-e1954]